MAGWASAMRCLQPYRALRDSCREQSLSTEHFLALCFASFFFLAVFLAVFRAIFLVVLLEHPAFARGPTAHVEAA